jgi:uncharacterized protein YdeI (YjbR/CyaY-like superfamily)
MNVSSKVTAYIEKHAQWTSQLLKLRTVFSKTELKEEIKWGSPTYTWNKKLVAGMAAFKNHYALWFHQGVFLIDKDHNLVNAQEGKTKALRQWRFEEGDIIDEDLVLFYIEEAIQNCKDGKELKIERKAGITVPSLLKTAFKENTKLAAAFKKLTPGKQREYAEYIGEAKREETRQSRLEKIIPMILESKGLHDKYKNC